MADPLDTSVSWPLDDDAPDFRHMVNNWPTRATAMRCLHVVYRREVERAAQPPVVNVTVAGVPGHFTGIAGTGDVAYLPGTAPS